MEFIKTKAYVEDQNHLKLLSKIESLEKGAQVEVAIFIKNNMSWLDRKQILLSIGTYTKADLSGFTEARILQTGIDKS